MMVFIIAIHVTVCICLIILVLVQRGRGGGLVESFAGVESMFGTKTNTFLTRTTTVLSILFFITCLSLAVLSVRQSKSLFSNINSKGRAIKKLTTSNAQVPQQAAPALPQSATVAPAATSPQTTQAPAQQTLPKPK